MNQRTPRGRTAIPEARTGSKAQNKALARRFLKEVVNTGAVDRLTEYLAPDFVAHHLEMNGVEAARQHMLAFHQSYPDLRVTVDGQVAEGDIVVTWWTMRGTHLGEYGGIKPTGKVMVLKGVNVQRIQHHRIIEQWGGSNSLEALLKIGAIHWNINPSKEV